MASMLGIRNKNKQMMKTTTVLAVLGMVLLFSCNSNDIPDSFEPQLFADEATDVTSTRATLNGNIVLKGNTAMPELRFKYGYTEEMDKTTNEVRAINGNVATTLTNLMPSTKYYYCLQGNSGRVVFQSNIMTFNTAQAEKPQLFVDDATGITHTEATLTGFVFLPGNTQMPELQFKYGTTEDMELTANEVNIEDNRVTTQLTGLEAGTTYYYCLQGNDGARALRSETKTFATIAYDKPTVGNITVMSQGPLSIIVSYDITSDGGTDVTESGCYVTESGSGTTTKVSSPTAGTGTKKLLISGLKKNTSYSIQAFATNSVGTAVGSRLDITTIDGVILQEAGQFEELMRNDKYNYTSLVLTGPLNGDDLRCLRQMMGRNLDGSTTPGRLTDIDLTDASIVEGGGTYGSSRFTKDNVVGYGLFADCDKLTRVALPNSATTIEKNALQGCASLATLTIPASASSVTPSEGCASLANIMVSGVNTSYKSIDGVLFDASGKQIVWFPVGKEGEYVLPATVTSISDYAFSGCRISHFTLPDNLTELGQAVFYNSSVEEVVMPEQLRLVPTATFQKCTKLNTVRLGSYTELISDFVFDGAKPQHIYISAIYPPVCNANAFSSTDGYDITATCTLHVPARSRAMYKSDRNWGKFANIIGE